MTSDPRAALLNAALNLAKHGVPVLPLSARKRPMANCPTCKNGACGERPNMLAAGPCHCPQPCHAWAAATTNPTLISSPPWARTWARAGGVGYHPGGAGLTVVDLDTEAAVAWARATLPATRRVATTRGEHWIYTGTTRSANSVRPGVDIKSRMQYARWLGPGIGTMTPLPDAVLRLLDKEETNPPPRGAGLVSSTAPARWDRTVATGCRHTTRYIATGLERGLAMIRERHEQGAGSRAFGVAQFIARQHTACPGPCGLDAIAAQLINAAMAVGVPEPYAARAVHRGMNGTEHAA
ncbi:bifunctional DNA primase/polymerase [Streptomyces sp. NBRC 109706]|uniref:bifunctional DNA primase/polymerase n=1 Tax=Streptomyces sp. NBRC 109706 TaxID=1550035 RepID=UPI000783D3E8|nr:bifunctional DNA primase/polymerase [Streptomyces sp. NBRC 109706]